MKDSCKPSKLDPGLATANSMPRSLIVWTMRSEPGRVIKRAAAGGRTLPASRASWSWVGAGRAAAGVEEVRWASAIGAVVASAAAPAAALFRKPLRPTEFFSAEVFCDFAMISPLCTSRAAPSRSRFLNDKRPQPQRQTTTTATTNDHNRNDKRQTTCERALENAVSFDGNNNINLFGGEVRSV